MSEATVDRIMRSFVRTHPMTAAQAKLIREEIARFVEELLAQGKSRSFDVELK